MSNRLKKYIKQGLLERYQCLLSQPERVLWVQIDAGENQTPGVRVTTLLVDELEQLDVNQKYDALIIEAACLDVTHLPSMLRALNRHLTAGAVFYYAFYALDSAKEYLTCLTDLGFPAMQPFLDMHDVADIIMAEQITDVVSDNEAFQLPELSKEEWTLELEAAQLLPAIDIFAKSHDITLPNVSELPEHCFSSTRIELGFIHGVYQPSSKELKPGVHAVPLSQLGGLKKGKA